MCTKLLLGQCSFSPLCLAPALYLRLENKKKVDLTLIGISYDCKPPRGIFHKTHCQESLDFFDKNSAEEILPKIYKEIKVFALIRVNNWL